MTTLIHQLQELAKDIKEKATEEIRESERLRKENKPGSSYLQGSTHSLQKVLAKLQMIILDHQTKPGEQKVMEMLSELPAAKLTTLDIADIREALSEKGFINPAPDHLTSIESRISHRIMIYAAMRNTSGFRMNQYTIEDIIKEELSKTSQ